MQQWCHGVFVQLEKLEHIRGQCQVTADCLHLTLTGNCNRQNVTLDASIYCKIKLDSRGSSVFKGPDIHNIFLFTLQLNSDFFAHMRQASDFFSCSVNSTITIVSNPT